MIRTRDKRKFAIEALEKRCLLAGNVTTSFANGILTINGDSASNAIAISSPSEGVFKVTGLMQGGSATLIEGQAFQQSVGVTGIVINFNDGATGLNVGNDVVVITNLTITGSVSITTGDGDDFIGIGNFDNTGGEVDSAVDSLQGAVHVHGGFNINMQGGDNTVSAQDVSSQTPGANMTIAGGDGSDTVTLKNTTIIHGVSFSDSGDSTLDFDNLTTKNLKLALGIGNDSVTLQNSTVSVSAAMNTGFGNDIVNLQTDTLGSLNTILGPGDDQFTGDNVTINGPTTVNGGTGNNTLTLNTFHARKLNVVMSTGDDQMSLTGVTARNVVLNGGKGANTVAIDNLTATSLTTKGGSGNDQIDLSDTTLTKFATIDTGAGNDSLTLDGFSSKSLRVTLDSGADGVSVEDVTVTGKAFFGGGAGDDTFTDLGDNSFGNLTKRSFEPSGSLMLTGTNTFSGNTTGSGTLSTLGSGGTLILTDEGS
jgi:fibronectin-binding autotransporter adhesin